MSQLGIELLEAFSEALNRHDIDAVMAMMTEDCEFHALAGPELMGKRFVGQAEVRQALENAWKVRRTRPGSMANMSWWGTGALARAPARARPWMASAPRRA
ncbi:nuclear transport factor 2 family protein [Halomonas sp. IOP_31]|uniref:nuclear transport factor 2 family protein n=1 Tax=Halomonas sp. IOP_31 TaxID=2876584 RepID=UPI001E2F3C5E|nr:nuclear transport factor 2 family protein [Halomonas sp. IOP_31]MCD6007600.1 nuclear transport factor 2 family protein [Halomonas sp. IOP_31]